jgi:hypothetical protein
MSRALVPAKLIKPPKELEKFFDDPPLVGTERREDYDNFFSMIAMAVEPGDAIAWLLVKDVAYLSWEIRRERRIKAAIIKLKQKEAQFPSDMAMMRVDFEREKIAAKDPSAFKKKDLKLEATEEDSMWLLAKAYILGDYDIDVIDKRTASYEYRRNATLREMDLRSERMARLLEKASSDVIDGEFTEAAE